MNLITARNAHEMLPIALDRLLQMGNKRPSRNGDVIQLDGPTLLCYENPWERVVFWPERDANPFFHLMESLWMLAGREDVAFTTKYVKTMSDFSDDGIIFNGAYGYRWRYKFGSDQLDAIIERLRANPDCRRQVLSMWEPKDLFNQNTKDVPCNTHAYFAINAKGQLDMTVCNRSNDLVWGALGANAVHFSFLQEYMAAHIGVPMGRYFQFTNNLHGYLKTIQPLLELPMQQGAASPYELNNWKVAPLGAMRLTQLQPFLMGAQASTSDFLNQVALPMEVVHQLYREKNYAAAMIACIDIQSPDWQLACTQWLDRRAARRLVKAQDDGVRYE